MADEDGAGAREFGGFLSSARNFPLLPGPAVEPGAVRGYYIDFRLKARLPGWPPAWLPEYGVMHVNVAQWGLGAYERYLAGEGDQWLAWAHEAAAHLLELQRPDGGFPHLRPYHHTFKLDPPWLSAMAQGQAASLFVRLHLEQPEGERYAEAATRALRPYELASAEGGVRAPLGSGWFPEEYPTQPPSFVLNGGIFAIYGLYDVATALGDAEARQRFLETVDTLAENVHRWDTGFWSRYDLFPHPVPNVASSAYHLLHISQLEALQQLEPRPQTGAVLARFRRYQESRLAPRGAFAAKALFRVLVPRNLALARRLPWSPFFAGYRRASTADRTRA
jgi:heparosan-N-sulfate-glucuronate 5-epimerase